MTLQGSSVDVLVFVTTTNGYQGRGVESAYSRTNVGFSRKNCVGAMRIKTVLALSRLVVSMVVG